MGNPKAFLTIPRQESGHRPIHERVSDFSEVEQTLNEGSRILQASRCMDCGVPFCHWACPLGNKQPEWQDAVYKGKWELAYKILSETNRFVTGMRITKEDDGKFSYERRKIRDYQSYTDKYLVFPIPLEDAKKMTGMTQPEAWQ